MTLRHPVLAVLLLAGSAAAPGADFKPAVEFPVTDAREELTVPLGRDIVLHIKREAASAGWYLSATDRRLPDSPNFFYQCLCGHGPQPHELLAWHFLEMYYPGERILSVYGYPLEVRVRCAGCEVAGSVAEAHFVRGTVEVSWRRLAQSNPRQLHIRDLQR